MASKESGKFKSKNQIKCGYCKVSMRRDRLNEHTREQHPGFPKKEMGQVSLLDMFGTSRKRSRPEDIEDIEEQSTSTTKKRKSGDPSDDEEHDEDPATASEQLSDEESEELLEPGLELTEHKRPEEVVGLPGAESRSNPPNSEINEKLDKILEKMAELKLSESASTQSRPVDEHKSYEIDEVSAVKILVQASKSVQRLCEIAKLTADINNNILTCETCSADVSVRSRASAGLFHYDFSLGLDFTESNQPGPFSNLKKSVARHIAESAHQNNLVLIGKDTEEQRKLLARQQAIGMTVGKQAFRLLKYCRPFTDFEVDLLLLVDANVKIGNLNHSRKFPAELRPTFAEVIDNRVKDYVAHPLDSTSSLPPVGIVADKLTTRRRTGQMFAGVLFTPGMPSLLTPVSLGVESVTKHDGESIAQDIHDLCRKYNFDNDQIAGFGFDGQYFHLNVHTKLKSKMQLNDRVGFVWDSAHKLQLADKDMRKNTEWIDDTCNHIAAILGKFSFGKNFEAALDMAHNLGIDLKAPLWFSETRFAAYAHRVFKNFLENYGVVRRVLEKIAASSDRQAKEADDLLRRIRTLDFVVKLVVCTDFYRVLGLVSETLQRVDRPFWSKTKALETYLVTLGEMADWKADHFTAFYTYKADLEQCMFAGLPLLAQDRGLMIPLRETRARTSEEDDANADIDTAEVTRADAVITSVTAKGKAMFTTMKAKMKERFPQAYFDEAQDRADAAALFPILLSAKAATNEDVFLSSEEVSLLQSKHPTQSEGVRNLCLNIYRHRDSLSDCKCDTDLYHNVFMMSNLYIGAQHVLNTIALIYCSSPPESIVESMGSIIEKIKDIRGGSKTSTNKKDVKDISDELVIHWNGPHISKCNSVVRQTLNLHFKGRPWHFIAQDVRSKMHKVSAVVDRINSTKPTLSFMSK